MRSLLPLLLAPLFATGCGKGISGVWLFYIKFAGDDATTCEETITHNFTGAEEPEEEEIGDNNTATRSDTLIFADIQEGFDGNAVMVIENEVYPGIENDDGSWSFSWTGSQAATQNQTAETYEFTSDVQNSTTSLFKVTFDKAALTGSLSTTELQVASYTETDFIDPAPPIESQIPAAMFLQVPIEDTDRFRPAANTFDVEDCDSDPCELAVDSTCTTTQAVSATLTGYEGAEDYGAVGNARQNAGM